MSSYATSKSTATGKSRTLALKSARAEKYTPKNSSAKNAR